MRTGLNHVKIHVHVPKYISMEHLHSQPELTYEMGLKNAESVKDRILHVFISPE